MKIINKISVIFFVLTACVSAHAEIDAVQSILNMKVVKNGIYRVTYADMLNLNIDLSGTNTDEIAVMFKGVQVPAKVFSNTNKFGSESYIEFIGKSGKNLYQDGNIYTVTLSNAMNFESSNLVANEQLEVVSHYIQHIAIEENNEYQFGSPISDPWYKKRILAIGAEKIETLDFEIDNLVALGQVNIEMNVWGGTDFPESPDHHVVYELNGNTIDNFRFDGITSDIRQYSLSVDEIQNGLNQLDIRVPNDTNTPADLIHIESLKVSYPRKFVLIDNKLDFKIDLSNSRNAAEFIYINGFEESVAKPFSPINNYSISNANNYNYLVYQENLDGSFTEINTMTTNNCSAIASGDCYLNFSLVNNEGYVYVSSEAEIVTPQLSLPIILSEINEESTKYDYLIISHPDFIGDELDNFIALKEQSYRVKLVDVEQIYAQYNYYNISAQSIADYIKDVAREFGLNYVLLVGGDTYDYKNYLGSDSISFIPTLYGRTDEYISYAPVDAKFVDIDSDNIPDINIGRFPVRTEVELSNIIQKIQAYQAKTYHNTVLFAADKYDASNNYSFKNDAEDLINILPLQWLDSISFDSKAYLDNDGIALSKAKIINRINQGVALTSFVGHSGPRDWSFSGMFNSSDAQLLVNLNSPTIVTQWGCWNTYFVSPTEDTLAHAFMLNANGGAATVLGASTLTKAAHEKGLAGIVLRLLTHDEMTLGDAVTEAKYIYAQTNPEALDVILGWTILGDPSLRLSDGFISPES